MEEQVLVSAVPDESESLVSDQLDLALLGPGIMVGWDMFFVFSERPSVPALLPTWFSAMRLALFRTRLLMLRRWLRG